MRSAHRILSTAFGSRTRPAPAEHAPLTRAVEDSRPFGDFGRLTCSPWEGLYLELDN